MAVSKFIARNAPLIEGSFAGLADGMYGASRVLLGGAVTVKTSTTISVAPYSFIQAGLVAVNPDGHATVIVPDYATEKRPIYLVVSSPDITLASGVQITATVALYTITGVVLAVRTNDVWVSQPSASVTAADDQIRLVEKTLGTGVLSGLDPQILISGTDGATGIGVRVGQALAAQGIQPLSSGRGAGIPADQHVQLLSGPQDAFWPRSNYYLLRQPAGVTRAIGPALTVAPGDSPTRAGAVVDTSPVAATLAVRRSDGLTGVVWTKGTALKYATYNSQDTQVLAPVTITTSTGTFDGTRDVAAAIRSDGALVIAYCDPVSAKRVLKVVSVNFDTGVAVGGDGGVKTIGNLANQVRAPRFVLDATDTMHAVAQHNEGSPNNQVYYFRVTAAAGSQFGQLLSGTPRIVAGSNDGGNDTNPSVAVDAYRNVTIAYAKGTGSNVYGNLVVALLDPGGNTLSTTVVDTSAITAAGGIGTGYDTAATLARSAYPRVVSTPQGDTYVLFAASTGSNLQDLYLYSPIFLQRFGANCIDLFRTNAADVQWLEFFADDLGVLRAFSTVTTAAAPIQCLRLDTVVAPQNVLKSSVLDSYQGVAGNQFAVTLSAGGSNRFVVFDSVAATVVTATVSAGSNGLFTQHAADSILGAWSVQPLSGAQNVGTIRPQRVRPARFSNPIQVGRDGDFVGFDSLGQALSVASGSGLVVRLMPGRHELYSSFLNGALEVEGVPGAVVVVNSSPSFPINLSGRGSVTVTANPAPGVFDISAGVVIYPGDVLTFAPGGTPDPTHYHVVEVMSGTRIRVYPDATASTPAAANVLTSVRFKGIQFVGSAAKVQFSALFDPRIEDCSWEGVQLTFTSVEGGTFKRNHLSGLNVTFTSANRLAVVNNDAMGSTTVGNDGFIFAGSGRMVVSGNRSLDHGAGVYGYRVTGSYDYFSWGTNLGTAHVDDPGRLVSNNQVVVASEIIAGDIRVGRLNGGAYDAKIAAVAAEIDSLKMNAVVSGNFFQQFTFDDNSQLYWT